MIEKNYLSLKTNNVLTADISKFTITSLQYSISRYRYDIYFLLNLVWRMQLMIIKGKRFVLCV